MVRVLKPRILCIDDDPSVGELLGLWLATVGDFVVASETDALAAVRKAQIFKPDLLLLDITMPGRDGLAIAREIRQEPWFRRRPIIFYSGVSEPEAEAMQAGSYGPTKFLRKGTPLSVMEKTVREFLAEHIELYAAFKAMEGTGCG